MSGYPLHILGASEAESQPVAEPGWLEWLVAHLNPAWRPGEWDQQRWLFTSDLGSDRTAAGQGLGPEPPGPTCSGCAPAGPPRTH